MLLGFTFATGITCVAQESTTSSVKQIMQESQQAVDAIAMYPRETRKIIFQASEYPEVITKLNEMQKKSESAFASLISSFSKSEQEKIWNLTRYDFLISDLASTPKKSETEINALLVKYPEEIHKTALEEHKKNYNLLVQIDQMNRNYDSDFEFLINNYPQEAVNAFKEMINMPEVLGILNDNMPYTVVVGNYYKKNPDRILHKTDSLSSIAILYRTHYQSRIIEEALIKDSIPYRMIGGIQFYERKEISTRYSDKNIQRSGYAIWAFRIRRNRF